MAWSCVKCGSANLRFIEHKDTGQKLPRCGDCGTWQVELVVGGRNFIDLSFLYPFQAKVEAIIGSYKAFRLLQHDVEGLDSCFGMVFAYFEIIQTSSDPKEIVRSLRIIVEQAGYIHGDSMDYEPRLRRGLSSFGKTVPSETVAEYLFAAIEATCLGLIRACDNTPLLRSWKPTFECCMQDVERLRGK